MDPALPVVGGCGREDHLARCGRGDHRGRRRGGRGDRARTVGGGHRCSCPPCAAPSRRTWPRRPRPWPRRPRRWSRTGGDGQVDDIGVAGVRPGLDVAVVSSTETAKEVRLDPAVPVVGGSGREDHLARCGRVHGEARRHRRGEARRRGGDGVAAGCGGRRAEKAATPEVVVVLSPEKLPTEGVRVTVVPEVVTMLP